MLRIVRRGRFVAAAALMLGLAPVYTAKAAETSGIDMAATTLAPGRFVWRPEAASSGAVEVVVSLPQQLAYVYRGGTLIGVSTVSTGKAGHETPTGTFPILQKRRTHFSNRYDNAPMPFMQRLTWYGIALHGGAIPGRPASHGCVRLPHAFARHLFAATELGATVHIVDAAMDDAAALLEYAQAVAPSPEEIAAAQAA